MVKDLPSFLFKKHEGAFVFLLCAAEILLAIVFLLPQVQLDPYLSRDLARSLAVLRGGVVLAGPDTMGGGYSPGPFFYYLLAPFLWVSPKMEFIIAVVLVLRPLAKFYFARVVEKVAQIPTLFSYLLISSLLFFPPDPRWISNASFVALLAPLLLWLSFRFYRSSTWRNWLAANFAVALFLQIHYSFAHFFLLNGVLLFQEKKEARERIKFLLGAAALTLLVSSPYLYVVLAKFSGAPATAVTFNQSYGDGAHFLSRWAHSSGRFLRNGLSGVPFSQAPLVETAEVFLIGAFLLVRIPYLLRKRKFAHLFLKSLAYVSFFSFLSVVFFSFSAPRYLTAVYALAIPILAYDLWGFAGSSKNAKRIGFLLLTFLAADKMFGLVEFRGCRPCVSATLRDAQRTCEYFNRQKIGFAAFKFNSFEFYKNFDGENSFELAHECFAGEPGASPEHPYRYLVINKVDRDPLEKILPFLPPEFEAAFSGKEVSTAFETDNFLVLKSPEQKIARQVFSSNLAYPYELDPLLNRGMPLARNDLYGAFYKNRRVLRASLCADPFFCGISVFWRGPANGNAELYIVSRLLQTKWDMPPAFARLKNVSLNYLCGGAKKAISLAQDLGFDADQKEKRAYTTPLFVKLPATCTDFRPLSISFDGMILWVNLADTKYTNQYTELPLQ